MTSGYLLIYVYNERGVVTINMAFKIVKVPAWLIMEKEKKTSLVPLPLLHPWRLCSRVAPLCTKERGNAATVLCLPYVVSLLGARLCNQV